MTHDQKVLTKTKCVVLRWRDPSASRALSIIYLDRKRSAQIVPASIAHTVTPPSHVDRIMDPMRVGVGNQRRRTRKGRPPIQKWASVGGKKRLGMTREEEERGTKNRSRRRRDLAFVVRIFLSTEVAEGMWRTTHPRFIRASCRVISTRSNRKRPTAANPFQPTHNRHTGSRGRLSGLIAKELVRC